MILHYIIWYDHTYLVLGMGQIKESRGEVQGEVGIGVRLDGGVHGRIAFAWMRMASSMVPGLDDSSEWW